MRAARRSRWAWGSSDGTGSGVPLRIPKPGQIDRFRADQAEPRRVRFEFVEPVLEQVWSRRGGEILRAVREAPPGVALGALVESLFCGEPLPRSRTTEVRRFGEAHEATLDTSLFEIAIEDGCVLDQVRIGIEYG